VLALDAVVVGQAADVGEGEVDLVGDLLHDGEEELTECVLDVLA
jgi:hypothetical protein